MREIFFLSVPKQTTAAWALHGYTCVYSPSLLLVRIVLCAARCHPTCNNAPVGCTAATNCGDGTKSSTPIFGCCFGATAPNTANSDFPLLLLPNTELTSKNTFVFALGAEFVCARFISQSCAPFSPTLPQYSRIPCMALLRTLRAHQTPKST